VLTPGGPLTVFAGAPLDGIHRSVRALQSSLAVGIPFLVAIVAALAWFVTGRALRPVEAMRSEVEEITAGTLHRRVPEPDTGDEVSRLARTMNAMLDRLEQSSDKQRQFVSDASHELRSPVAAIRTHLEVGLANPDSTDWPVVARKTLDEEARLETLVADLLLLASVDEQSGNGAIGDVDLAALARDEAVRVRRVPVHVEVEGGVMVRGRSDRLGRALANLLDNACRYATSGVQLAVSRTGDRARLVVEDDGPGIPIADRERVFERFTRLDGSRARGDAGGAGLGLALAKAIVEQHDGSITITDAEPTGARVEVILPATR
jgi:signal transduction histidine kinase